MFPIRGNRKAPKGCLLLDTCMLPAEKITLWLSDSIRLHSAQSTSNCRGDKVKADPGTILVQMVGRGWLTSTLWIFSDATWSLGYTFISEVYFIVWRTSLAVNTDIIQIMLLVLFLWNLYILVCYSIAVWNLVNFVMHYSRQLIFHNKEFKFSIGLVLKNSFQIKGPTVNMDSNNINYEIHHSRHYEVELILQNDKDWKQNFCSEAERILAINVCVTES